MCNLYIPIIMFNHVSCSRGWPIPRRCAHSWSPADAICSGGDIVTADDKNPTAEAIAVEDGKIIAVGNKADVLKLK